MITEPRLRRPGVVTLLTAAFAQSADLLQTEFRLARAELSEKLAALRGGLVMMAVGAILLIVSLGMLLQALVSALIAAGLSPPAAILLVAGGTAVVGLVLFLMGQKRLSPETLNPERTIHSLSRDSRMVKESLS
jgi:putative superfamily III holin-X